jgi:putative ABC transport system substrate-binding protein
MSSSSTNFDGLACPCAPVNIYFAQMRLGLGLLLLLALATAQAAQINDGASVAVIYPELGEPFRSIFAKIIEGIEEQAHARINNYPIGQTMNTVELNTKLKRTGTKVVIALGRQGLKTAMALDADIAIVVSGVLSVPEMEGRNLTGITLTPDPALLFAQMKRMLPGIKRVHVVLDPLHNQWLLKLARDAAKNQGLELVVYEARDPATAVRSYQIVLAKVDSRVDALWLPHDPTTVDEETILPLVLKESWNRGIAVFSSSLLHVGKGVLFALYPDNLGLGHDLAKTAASALAGEAGKNGVSPLREVMTAVNLRTAAHLGINFSPQQQRSFDFVFPEP